MREENKIITIIKNFIGYFRKKNELKAKRESDKLKRQMCISATQSNVCSRNCESCAWNVL
jgi:hypothetical protein